MHIYLWSDLRIGGFFGQDCQDAALMPAGCVGHCIQRLEPPVKQACHAGPQPQSAIDNGYASKLLLPLIVEGLPRIFWTGFGGLEANQKLK